MTLKEDIHTYSVTICTVLIQHSIIAENITDITHPTRCCISLYTYPSENDIVTSQILGLLQLLQRSLFCVWYYRTVCVVALETNLKCQLTKPADGSTLSVTTEVGLCTIWDWILDFYGYCVLVQLHINIMTTPHVGHGG